MSKITCCQIATIYETTFYKQIQGKQYFSLGFQTGYYHLFKELEKENQLCEKCLDFSGKLFEICQEIFPKIQAYY